MKNFEVIVNESIGKTFIIEAESKEKAEGIVRGRDFNEKTHLIKESTIDWFVVESNESNLKAEPAYTWRDI